MKTATVLFENNSFLPELNEDNLDFGNLDLVLDFGSRDFLSGEKIFNKLKNKFPSSQLIFCSLTDDIYEKEVFDNIISLSATFFF